jgi:hypothetical protein
VRLELSPLSIAERHVGRRPPQPGRRERIEVRDLRAEGTTAVDATALVLVPPTVSGNVVVATVDVLNGINTYSKAVAAPPTQSDASWAAVSERTSPSPSWRRVPARTAVRCSSNGDGRRSALAFARRSNRGQRVGVGRRVVSARGHRVERKRSGKPPRASDGGIETGHVQLAATNIRGGRRTVVDGSSMAVRSDERRLCTRAGLA